MASEIVLANPNAAHGDWTMGIHTDIHKPCKWEWRKDGDPIPGAQSAPSYTAPMSSQGGSYTCVVTGIHGDWEETPAIVLTRQVINVESVPEKQVFPKAVVDAVMEQVHEEEVASKGEPN